jgi:hypothetical protein
MLENIRNFDRSASVDFEGVADSLFSVKMRIV